MNKQYFQALAATAILAAGSAAAEAVTDTITRAIDEGTLNFAFRYRYEFVDDGDFSKDANANTLKSRLSFAPKFDGDWSFLLEVDDVRHLGADTFNSTRNDRPARPPVLDPQGTDLNQLLVRYKGFDKTELVFGRQRINRGNQRYVGGVGWRQNEQTFDSVSASYGQGTAFQAFYSYVFQVNRIYGPEQGTPPADLNSKTHLLDGRYSFSKALNLGGYVYLMDFDDADSLSNSTLGIRLDGGLPLAEDLKLDYVAEFARQGDYGDNPVSYDADYYLLEATLGWADYNVLAGYEVLGGNDSPGGGFRTPLATLHAFQGWADRFAVASGAGLDQGIEDFYVGVGAKLFGGQFLLRYHDFGAEQGSSTLGTEFDASASWSFTDHYGVLVKWASYDADSYSFDLSKFWLQLTANF